MINPLRGLLSYWGLNIGITLREIFQHSNVTDVRQWNKEFDVVIVGSGAAGCAAALAASRTDAKVVMIEKSFILGGTSKKAGFFLDVPNNPWMREHGLTPNRLDYIKLAASQSFPELFDENAQFFGIPQNDYEQIAAYFDHSYRAFQEIHETTPIRFELVKTPWLSRKQSRALVQELLDSKNLAGYSKKALDFLPNSYADDPLNRLPVGSVLSLQLRLRHILLSILTLSFQKQLKPLTRIKDLFRLHTYDNLQLWMLRKVNGALFLRETYKHLLKRGIPIKRGHVLKDILFEDGRVIGIEVLNDRHYTEHWRAKNVVLATGGFAHDFNRIKKTKLQLHSTCAELSDEGDTPSILHRHGISSHRMDKGWCTEMALESTVRYGRLQYVPTPFLAIDGSVLIDLTGRRFRSETSIHDEQCYETRKATIFVCDERAYELHYGLQQAGSPLINPEYVIRARSVNELSTLLNQYFGRKEVIQLLGERLTPSAGFASKLQETLERYNASALQGQDLEFGKGSGSQRILSPMRRKDNWHPNKCLHPIDETKLCAVVLGLNLLGTKGGPRINAKAQVLADDGSAIPNLFAAGNCACSFQKESYFTTLGPAITFGYVAGLAATDQLETSPSPAKASLDKSDARGKSVPEPDREVQTQTV